MKLKTILLPVVAVIIMTLGLNSCSKSDSNPNTPANPLVTTIKITGMSFPATTTVAKGTKVSWNNADGTAHTVTSDDNTSFSSGNLAAGATFVYQANTAGTFPYHCNYHANMTGTLVVTP
jgi:plastocyanin